MMLIIQELCEHSSTPPIKVECDADDYMYTHICRKCGKVRVMIFPREPASRTSEGMKISTQKGQKP